MKETEKEKVTKFTVKRSEWFRGKGHEESMLLMPNGTKCCVGFYALACGLSEAQIAGFGTIDSVSRFGFGREGLPEQLSWMCRDRTYASVFETVRAIYQANDDPEIDNATRERRLTELFASMGIEIVFED